MLRELPNARQVPGEPRRRWFFCHEADLVVWCDAAGQALGFQFAYDKYRGERSVAWDSKTGLRHFRVDDGEDNVATNATPFLYRDGAIPHQHLRALFDRLADELPVEIAAFVRQQLSEAPLTAIA